MMPEAPLPHAAAQRLIGKPVQRREDPRLITGRGRYVDDVVLPGMLHATFVRSQSARGTITHLDVSAARRHPGVVAVFTAVETNSPSHQFWVTMMGPDAGYPPGRVLADGDVRYVGEPIVIVVAESRYVAEDAAELVDVDVEPLPPVMDMFAAIEDTDVLVHPELGSNVAGDMPADVPGLDERLAAAPHTFTETFLQHRYVQVPMETRGIVASWDRMLEHLEITVSGQSAHETRLFYSRMLGIPEDAIHVVMGDVGGSFGQKMFTQREEHAIVIAARAIGDRPVKWIEDRAENLISGGHARQEAMRVTVAVDDDGVLVGGRAWHLEDVGAYPYPGNGAAGASSLALFPGPYRWGGPGSVAYHAQAAFTNTCGRTAYRGPWMMETTGREQMMDVVAQKLGIDPLEMRRRNIVSRDEMPFTSPMQLQFETISPAETLEQAAEMIGYDAFREEQGRLWAEGRLVGIGLSSYVEPQFGFGILATEAATIRIEPSGKVNVYTSTGNHGQSLETTIAQVIADELGVPFDDVRIIQNDTARTPYGAGTGGSRSAAIASGAAHAAASSMREKVLQIGAHLLEASVEDVELVHGVVSVRGVPGAEVPLGNVAAVAYLDTDALPPGVSPGLEVSERYKAPSFMFSNATHAVTVEVDRVTGQVQILRYVVSEDCGNMINPMVVEGQIVGGIAQAVGGVFYEHMVYDEDGNPTTTTFLDYLVPTAAEIPEVELGHVVTPSNTPGGYKGLGEGGAICAPAALLNAVRDALAPLGVSVTEQPLSPDRVLQLIESASGS
jgi:carbon-monoxide dehydrogenase large subunit